MSFRSSQTNRDDLIDSLEELQTGAVQAACALGIVAAAAGIGAAVMNEGVDAHHARYGTILPDVHGVYPPLLPPAGRQAPPADPVSGTATSPEETGTSAGTHHA